MSRTSESSCTSRRSQKVEHQPQRRRCDSIGTEVFISCDDPGRSQPMLPTHSTCEFYHISTWYYRAPRSSVITQRDTVCRAKTLHLRLVLPRTPAFFSVVSLAMNSLFVLSECPEQAWSCRGLTSRRTLQRSAIPALYFLSCNSLPGIRPLFVLHCEGGLLAVIFRYYLHKFKELYYRLKNSDIKKGRESKTLEKTMKVEAITSFYYLVLAMKIFCFWFNKRLPCKPQMVIWTWLCVFSVKRSFCSCSPNVCTTLNLVEQEFHSASPQWF